MQTIYVNEAGQVVNPTMSDSVNNMAQAINDTVNRFSDKVPNQNNQKQKETEAKNFINQFTDYIKSSAFFNAVNDASVATGVPPKRIAEGFFGKILGTVGDILGIAIGTVRNTAHGVIDLLATVLHGTANVICNVANAIASIFTLNRTVNVQA